MSDLLRVEGLKVHFDIGRGMFRRSDRVARAVDGVDLALRPGEVLGLVGESGCGKTTVAQTLVGLIEPTAGTILFDGEAIAERKGDGRIAYRRAVQMVFQDPFDSLNPRKTVFKTIAQPLRIHGIVPGARLREEVVRLLNWVGLSPGGMYLDRYPHQFSGGQRQRICIARAIAVRPRAVIADEPVSALDVSIRAQILALFRRMSQEFGVASIFITHDLSVVRSLCDRVAVMYLGRIVELGRVEDIFDRPSHPYTRSLLAASPVPDPSLAKGMTRKILTGDVPSPIDPPPGCHFHTRCPYAADRCHAEVPTLRYLDDLHQAACHFSERAAQWS